jgi:predicted dehydrogenase
MQLYGERGRIEVEIPFNAPADAPCRVFVDDGSILGGRSATTIEMPVADQYRLQSERFAAAVRGAGNVAVSLETAVGNMAVIDALFRAAESQRWERIDNTTS